MEAASRAKYEEVTGGKYVFRSLFECVNISARVGVGG